MSRYKEFVKSWWNALDTVPPIEQTGQDLYQETLELVNPLVQNQPGLVNSCEFLVCRELPPHLPSKPDDFEAHRNWLTVRSYGTEPLNLSRVDKFPDTSRFSSSISPYLSLPM